MKKTKLFLSLVFIMFAACGLLAKTDTKKEQKIKYPSEKDFDMGEFNQQVMEQYEMLKVKAASKTQLEKMKSMDILINAISFSGYAKHPYIEKATRIKRGWFKKVANYMNEMSKYKTEMEVTEKRDLKKRYRVAEKKFAILAANFKKVIKKPEKLKRRSRRKSGRR